MLIRYYWSKVLKKIRGSAIKNSEIHPTSKVESGSNIVNTFMDRHSFCGYNCEINYCKIGSFTSIANGVVIGGGMHPVSWASMSPVFYSGSDSVKRKYSKHDRAAIKETNIGHDVWIGQNVLIKQGVNIGTGSIIGMGSIVTKDIAPYSIVAGNPAKEIKKRFSEKVIINLLNTEWWLLDDNKLNKIAHLIKEPEKIINMIKNNHYE